MRALRFRPDGPAEVLGTGAVPEAPGGEVWLDLQRGELDAPPPSAGAWLGQLHPLTQRALGQPDPRGLAAAQQHYVHIRLPLPGAAEGPTPLDLVVGDGYVLSVHGGTAEAWNAVWGQYAEGGRRADAVDFALYQALRALLAVERRAGEDLVAQAEGVDQRLVRLSEQRILREIVGVRRRAIALRGRLVAARDGLQLLAGGGGHSVREENRPYFADLRRETAETLEAVDEVRAAMGEAVEAFTSVQSTEMNRVMQIFTVLAVVIAPPMLVASIYGMNFKIPEYHWAHGYTYALGLMAVTGGALYLYVRGRHWL